MSATDLAVCIEEVRGRLRTALLTGADTRDFRAVLEKLEQEVTEAATTAAQAEARRKEQEAQEIARCAKALVFEAEARLHARLAALAPPPPFTFGTERTTR